MQAQVYKIHSDFYYVKNKKNIEYVCKLREILKKQKIDINVGDFVELSEDLNFIVGLLNRKNYILKPKVSNIDLAIVVCALKEPELDFIQLNRYLIYLKSKNIEAAICFNKEDLIEDLSEIKEKIIDIYSNLGYKIFFISAKNKLGIDKLKDYIKNKTIVLCGMSGVGKSTLLNSINDEISIKTNTVSKKTQKGRHTTRHVEIIDCIDFKIVDTPGFSCLKFDYLLPEDLIELFDDIKIYKGNCKYSNCLHNINKTGVCSVVDNLDKINISRYESYLTFLEESLEYKKNISKKSIKKEKNIKNVGNKVFTKISKQKRAISRNTQNQSIGVENE